WHEIPDFIPYCNNLDIPVYIHTVFYPAQCAIRTMTPEQLKPIVERLQSFNFPADTPIQKKNRVHYQDFVNQIVSWSLKTGNGTAPAKGSTTFEEAREKIFSHISQNAQWSESDKAARIEVMAS